MHFSIQSIIYLKIILIEKKKFSSFVSDEYDKNDLFIFIFSLI